MARTFEDRVVDKFLSAYVASECRNTYEISHLSETKFQKLVYLSERKLLSNDIKAFNYSFMFFKKGPYSAQVRNDFNFFKKLENLNEQYLTSSQKIDMIIEDFCDVLERNDDIVNRIDRVLTRYATLDLREIINRVYNLTYKGRKIRNLKLKTPLTFPISTTDARSYFDVKPDELEDLKMCFDKDFDKIMMLALSDVREGRISSHEEAFREL